MRVVRPLRAARDTLHQLHHTRVQFGRFLAETIDSVLAQTIRIGEVLVVDDGSTDDTLNVAESFGDRVRWIQQPNAGPAAARNNGVRNTAGEFIAFIDSDDIWTPDKTERQLARFEANPELQVCFGELFNFRTNTENGRFRDGYSECLDWPRVPFSPGTLFARRGGFVANGDFDETLRRAEDTEWFVRMMMRKLPYEVLPERLMWRRVHDRNLTLESPPGPQEVVRSLKIVLDRRRSEGW